VLQSRPPLGAISTYVDGFHFTNGSMASQMEAHHYCDKVNEDFTQCVLFDGNGKDARMIGIEYIVSKKLFSTLPEHEKASWHSHVYEIKSGQLIAPGLLEVAEHELMEQLVSTYGKTWHTWHTDRNNSTLPVGAPALMMGFTADGQIDPNLLADRDRRFKVSSQAERQKRGNIQPPLIHSGADAWQAGRVMQLQLLAAPREAEAALPRRQTRAAAAKR
jgi:hypothetical protein